MKEKFEALKKSEAFKIFINEVEDKAKEWKMILQNSNSIEMIYRAQGALMFAEKIMGLIDELIEESEEDESVLGI